MIDFEKITGFQWDAGNAYKSQEKHGVSQGEAEEVFFNQPLLVEEDERHSDNESRLLALGITNSMRLLSIIFTLRNRDTLIRIVSARSMSKRERACYEKA
jgi:uncharacterized DUF497 family protein